MAEGQQHDLIEVAEDELVGIEEDDTRIADERPGLRLGVDLLPRFFLKLCLEGCASKESAPACMRACMDEADQAAGTRRERLQAGSSATARRQ